MKMSTAFPGNFIYEDSDELLKPLISRRLELNRSTNGIFYSAVSRQRYVLSASDVIYTRKIQTVCYCYR